MKSQEKDSVSKTAKARLLAPILGLVALGLFIVGLFIGS